MQELNWKKDLRASLDIIENTESIIGDNYQHYAKIFNIPDTNHKDLFTKLKTDKKSYLGVAGSTDPMLNVVALEYKNITVFDINILNIHFMFLKLSAILALDYEEYLEFFYSSDAEKYFSKKYFQKLKVELPYESLEYWKGIYEICNADSFNDLFYSGKLTSKDYEVFRKVIIPSNIFLEKQSFYALKKQLKQIKLTYFIEDFGEIPNLINPNSTSLIYLSNMQNYIYDNV